MATRAVVGGAVGGIAAAFLAVPAVSAVAIALGFAAVAGLVTARQRRMSEPAPTCLPARWSFAPPPEGPIERIVEGPIDPLGELLQAPLSGRPCVAYELGVRRDRSAGAPLDSWLLLEHRIAPAAVAGEPLEILPHLRLDREPPIDADARDLAPAAVDFLRRRGIVLEGDPLLLFETVVLPGAHVRLEHRDDGTVLAPGTERRALAASSPTPPS